jgi:putative transposase
MSKRGHTEEQILRALRQAEGGTKIIDICREHGISEATYYSGRRSTRDWD